MSYYITHYEVPVEIIEKLLLNPTDDDYHFEIFEAWRTSIKDKNLYRHLNKGNIFIDWASNFSEYEKHFYDLLLNNDEWTTTSNDLYNGCPGIVAYRTPEQLQKLWKILEGLIHNYPEYKVENLLQEQISGEEGDGPSSIENFIRYYYGCSIRKSADVEIHN